MCSIEKSRRFRSLSSLGSAAALLWLAAPALAQNQVWLQRLTSNGWTEPLDAAADGSGGMYVIGRTEGDLGGTTAGGFDAWFARYDGAGGQTWIRQLGSSAWDYGLGCGADASGVFLCGRTEGSLGGPNAGDADAWLARYDSAGNSSWLRQLGTSEFDMATDAVEDGSGGTYVCGFTFGDLGGLHAGEGDAWLARYDASGNQVWIRQLGSSDGDFGYAVTDDGAGGAYVAGGTMGSLGGTVLGTFDAWIARYDGAGNSLWLRQLGSSKADLIRDCAADGAGGVLIAGRTEGNLAGPNAGQADPWVARLDAAGNTSWIRQFGTSAREEAWTVVPDGAGGAYVGGESERSNGAPIYAWLARFDGAGTQLWFRSVTVPGSDVSYASAQDGAGGVLLVGRAQFQAWLARFEPLCGPASVALRNAGPNALSLQASAPVLGSPFTATVDLTTTGHGMAVLYALDGAIDVPWRGGPHILIGNLFDHGLLFRGAQPGPLAVFSLALPNDASLCNFPLSMQAVHVGTVTPFALSNAVDLVIGG